MLQYLKDVPLEDSADWLSQSTTIGEVSLNARRALRENDDEAESEMLERWENLLRAKAETMMNDFSFKEADVLRLIQELAERQESLSEVLTDGFSRKFLPKFAFNTGSKICHSVRDEWYTACGLEWRMKGDIVLTNEIPEEGRLCAAPSCLKALRSK